MPAVHWDRTQWTWNLLTRASRLISELLCSNVVQCFIFKAEIGKHALEVAALCFKHLEACVYPPPCLQTRSSIVTWLKPYSRQISTTMRLPWAFFRIWIIWLAKIEISPSCPHQVMFTRNLYSSMALYYGKATSKDGLCLDAWQQIS